MVKRVITYIKYPVLFFVVVFCLLGLAQAVFGSNIDPTDKWAWGANAGWINFNPQCDGCEGVTVYADHLEGYAWGANVGWIRMGAQIGGGSHTYANDSASNYGVNVGVSGDLSGYGWGAHVGWIDFAPNHGGVTIDTATGEFDGYAWGENIGWIRCKGTAPIAYNVIVNPDLEIVKQATARVDPGETVTYTLVFTNHGPVRAAGVVITDRLPISVTSPITVHASLPITPTAGITYTWTLPDLAPGQGGVITITGKLTDLLPGGHTFANTAEIAADADSNSSNNRSDADVTVTNAQLKITKDVSDPTPDPGATIAYTVVVTNSGPDDATGVVVSDTLPGDISNVSSSVTQGEYVNPVWDVGDLGIGVSATLRITGTVRANTPDGTIITNTAVISACDQGDSEWSNDEDDATIVVRGAELALIKTVDNPTPHEGSSVTYAITVTNSGFTSTVVISDVLPSGVSYVSDDGDKEYDDGSGKWDVGELVNGASKTLHITALVDVGTAGATVTNTAAITDTSLADPNPSDDADEASIKPQGADLEVDKTVSNYTPNEGSTVVYTVTVTNHGPADTVGVVISDALPSGVSHQSHDGDGDYDDATGVWDMGDLVEDASATLHITVAVNAGTAGQTITNTAVVSESGRTDLFPGNNQDDAFIHAQAANAVIVIVTPSEGGDLDCGVTIEIPPNAVADSITLICTPISTPVSIPSGWLFAGHAFNLDAYLEGVLQPGFVFMKPVTIAIHYSDEDVAGLIEGKLALEYRNGEAWEDAVCGEYAYHPDENWMAVPICHLTPFALLGRGFPIGGVTLLASSWYWLVLAALVVAGAVAATTLKRRAA